MSKLAVITGASAGIGYATAGQLLEAGYDVVNLSRRPCKLDGVVSYPVDLADPVAFFRGEVETELAQFWTYVFGAGGATDPRTAATYSQVMADSQVLVAEDTLATVDLSKHQRILDVGGGTGACLAAVGTALPAMHMTLFDLPAVAPAAATRRADRRRPAQRTR